MLDATNNFWGWTATAREIVRDDQWQEMADVYVRDKHQLGLRQWFEQNNPHALAQTMERMLEAARQGYWQTDAATLRELKERWRDLARRFDVRTDNAAFAALVGAKAQPGTGYGLDAPAAARPTATAPPAADNAPPPEPAAAAQPEPEPAPPPPVSGLLMQPVTPPDDAPPPGTPLRDLAFGLLLAALTLGGAWRQRAAAHRFILQGA